MFKGLKYRAALILLVLLALLGSTIPVFVAPQPVYAATATMRPGYSSSQGIASQYPEYGYHWDKTDEASQDGDTTYIYTGSSSTQYSFFQGTAPPEITAEMPINSVTVYALCEREGASYSRYGYVALYTHGTYYYSSSQYLYSTDWSDTVSKTWTTNPYTGAAWTLSELDFSNFKFGVGLAGYSGIYYAKCTQVYVVVDYTPIVITAPDISTVAASSIAKTTARLNAVVIDDGNEACEVRWGYGETSEAAIEDYDTYTSFAGSYTTGQYPYYDASSLSADTLYYFRVEIQNSDDTDLGDELSFTTSSAISDVDNFWGIPSNANISLSWARGDGATQVLVRYRLDTFPSSTSDGTLVYLGSGGSYTFTGLTAGRTYYFAAWGESGGSYSASAINLAITTLGTNPVSGSDIGTPSLPETFFQDPDPSGFGGLEPIPSIISTFASSWGMPLNNMWFLLTMMFIIGVTMWILIKFKSLLGASLFAFLALVVAIVLHLVPSWMLFVPACVALGAWAVWRLKPVS